MISTIRIPLATCAPLVLALGACDVERPSSLATPLELEVGVADPRAPEDWPLLIGDTISASTWRQLTDRYPKWEGNRAVSQVDGVYYHPDFESTDVLLGDPHGFIFKGYVKALTREDRGRSGRPQHRVVPCQSERRPSRTIT